MSPRPDGADFSMQLADDVLRHVASLRPGEAVETMLERAGPDVAHAMREGAIWLSYEQMRRLLEQAAAELGGAAELARVIPEAILRVDPELDLLEALRGFGSPDSLYECVPRINGNFMPMLEATSERGGEREWILHMSLPAGVELYPELCSLVAGLCSAPTLLFGYEAAEVSTDTHSIGARETCSCRIRWREAPAAERQLRLAELDARAATARLRRLQGLVGSVAAGGRDPGDVLRRIMIHAARAVVAPKCALAVRAGTLGAEPLLIFEGMDPQEAEALAASALAAGPGIGADRLVATVSGGGRDFGCLIVVDAAARLFELAPGMVETYAQLAASFIGTQLGLGTASALLRLSGSLAELASPGEIALRLVRAAPEISGCARAMVYLADGHGPPQLAAWEGYDAPPSTPNAAMPVAAAGSGREIVEMASEGETLGWLIAEPGPDAAHVQAPGEFATRLRGIASQGATAVANARLLERIRHHSLHDPLTGLANRALIMDRLEHMLVRSQRSASPPAVLFVDLDGFKRINDTMGHDAGDQLLKAVAARMRATVREADTIGRLGGDEFVILLDQHTMDVAPELVAERILDVLATPFELEGAQLPALLSGSVGIAVGDRQTATELLRDADVALYSAKAAGKGRVTVFRPEMQTAVRDRMLLEMDLREALEADQFRLVYQPILELASGRVQAVEALLRWRHPSRGEVEPDQFIPILEETGMIVPVGLWVLRRACGELSSLHRDGHAVGLTVNVSVRQLERQSFPEDVRGVLTASGLSPAWLTIEVTETALIRDAERVTRSLRLLRELGARVAIDDFGTGYSSLAYLRRFPVDTIKIDRSFVADMSSSTDSRAVVHTLVRLGKDLGLETLAEGIEDREQYSELRREQCDSGQGFLFTPPLEAGRLAGFLDARSPVSSRL